KSTDLVAASGVPAAGGTASGSQAGLAAEQPHVCFFVVVAGGRGEVVELADLLCGQLDAVGGGVLLHPGGPFGAGDRGDVVALGQQPGQGHLCRRGAGLGGDRFDLVGDPQVVLEVLAGEARVGLAPVAVVELPGGSDRPGEEAVA